MPTQRAGRPSHLSTGHLTPRRPRTSLGLHTEGTQLKPGSVQHAVSCEDKVIADDEEENFELLEYEWPDLPPIPSMKDAVSRSRVSKGISYLLPVDKGKNSINNRFRTDLRAMFQEPYASDDLQYDDNRVKLSTKVHFLSNSADTRWTPQLLKTVPTQLNAESDAVRKLYVHSAPTGGRTGVGIDPGKLRKRSNLYLPVKASKAQVSPEIVQLRNEAAAIIRQGLSYVEDDQISDTGRDEHNGEKKDINNGQAIKFSSFGQPNLSNTQSKAGRKFSEAYRAGHTDTMTSEGHGYGGKFMSTFGGNTLGDSLGTSALKDRLQNIQVKQHIFSNYEELRNAKVPKPVIPKDISSPYLSADLNQNIWEWLHYGESMSDFDFFLSVCG